MKGFTLVEVCVALAVLSLGSVVLNLWLDGFNKFCGVEYYQAKSFVAAVRTMELFVEKSDSCMHMVQNLNEVRDPEIPLNIWVEKDSLTPDFVWVHVETLPRAPAQSLRLKRLVVCK